MRRQELARQKQAEADRVRREADKQKEEAEWKKRYDTMMSSTDEIAAVNLRAP